MYNLYDSQAELAALQEQYEEQYEAWRKETDEDDTSREAYDDMLAGKAEAAAEAAAESRW